MEYRFSVCIILCTIELHIANMPKLVFIITPELLKQRIARKTGIPTTTAGIECKIGRSAINLLTGLFSKKKN